MARTQLMIFVGLAFVLSAVAFSTWSCAHTVSNRLNLEDVANRLLSEDRPAQADERPYKELVTSLQAYPIKERLKYYSGVISSLPVGGFGNESRRSLRSLAEELATQQELAVIKTLENQADQISRKRVFWKATADHVARQLFDNTDTRYAMRCLKLVNRWADDYPEELVLAKYRRDGVSRLLMAVEDEMRGCDERAFWARTIADVGRNGAKLQLRSHPIPNLRMDVIPRLWKLADDERSAGSAPDSWRSDGDTLGKQVRGVVAELEQTAPASHETQADLSHPFASSRERRFLIYHALRVGEVLLTLEDEKEPAHSWTASELLNKMSGWKYPLEAEGVVVDASEKTHQLGAAFALIGKEHVCLARNSDGMLVMVKKSDFGTISTFSNFPGVCYWGAPASIRPVVYVSTPIAERTEIVRNLTGQQSKEVLLTLRLLLHARDLLDNTVRSVVAEKLFEQNEPYFVYDVTCMVWDEFEGPTWRSLCMDYLRQCYERTRDPSISRTLEKAGGP